MDSILKTILHVIDTTGPGGAETVFIDLIRGLDIEKYRAIVLIRGKGWVYDTLIQHGIKPFIIEAKGSFNWKYLLKVARLIRAEKVDLIQSHLLGSNIYSSLAGLITAVPVVATFHGAVDIGENERFKWLKFKILNAGISQMLAVSNNLKLDMLNRTIVNKNKLSVIYNGIPTSDFIIEPNNRIRKSYEWEDGDIIVGSLGNIRTAKAYNILLEAAAIIKSKSLPYRFVIAGQGNNELHTQLLKQRHSLGLDDTVHFLGFNDKPAEFLSNLSIFLLTSSSEGFSIATIQAMASGLPVIATKSGGPEEIISHQTDGYLVDINNPTAIAEALEIINTNTKLKHDMAEAGRIKALKQFDISKMLASYEQLYESILHA